MNRLEAINMLEKIKKTLNENHWKEKSLCLIRNYKISLIIKINPKIEKMVKKYNEYVKKYGMNSKKTVELSKKINDNIIKIY